MKNFLNYLLNIPWILRIIMKFISNEKQKKIQIETLKSEFAFFGYDISDMTDEEIEDGILRVSELSKKCGVTAQECVEVCREMSKVAKANNQ